MKKYLRRWVCAAAGTMIALAFTSCTYDPYYSSPSVGASYSSGYGQGYGYGGSSFSTSVFVGTGDSRWGYDPTCYSYYDYRRRAYYDPYLYGYYPVGYRPPVVYGVPHPYGWRPGSGYCRPPSRVSNVTVVNYRNRESAYRNSDHQWASQVRQQPSYSGSYQQQHSQQGRYNRQDYNTRSSSGNERPYGNSYDRNRESKHQNYQAPRSGNPSRIRQENNTSLPFGYNTPVREIQLDRRREPQNPQYNTRTQPQPKFQREVRQLSQPDVQRTKARPDRSSSRGNRHALPGTPEQGAPGPL